MLWLSPYQLTAPFHIITNQTSIIPPQETVGV